MSQALGVRGKRRQCMEEMTSTPLCYIDFLEDLNFLFVSDADRTEEILSRLWSVDE